MSRSDHTDIHGGCFSAHLSWGRDHAELALAGELDRAAVHYVQDAIREITVRPGRFVRLDLSGLSFTDVAGTRALYQAAAELQRIGRDVEITGMQPRVRRVAAILGLTLPAGAVGCGVPQPFRIVPAGGGPVNPS